MADSYDAIEKSAVNYARDSDTIPFETLISGFGYSDASIAITLLRFINQMIFNANEEEEKKAARFVGKLECLGIYDLLTAWGNKDNEEINQ
tara:strand:- start:1087 stop:1359 length:273 start_codon:yes stop_codon:yes gene_type:complete